MFRRMNACQFQCPNGALLAENTIVETRQKIQMQSLNSALLAENLILEARSRCFFEGEVFLVNCYFLSSKLNQFFLDKLQFVQPYFVVYFCVSERLIKFNFSSN